MHSKGSVFAGSVALAALIGCGGGSSSTFSTSVPGSSPVDTLTPSQAAQFCSDVSSYLTKQVDNHASCQLAAVLATQAEAQQDTSLTDQELQAECTAFVPLACAALADAGTSSGGGADGGAANCGTAGCTATVSQVSACLNASGPAIAQWEAMFPSCSMVTRAKLATLSLDAGPMEPAACTVLDTTCAGFDPMPSGAGLGN